MSIITSLLTVGLLIGACVWWASSDNVPGKTSISPAQMVPRKYVANKNCFAAISEDKWHQFARLLLDKDSVAMSKMVLDGDAVEVPEGEEVVDVGGGFTAGLNGLRQFRRKGGTQTYWVAADFLKEVSP